MRTIYLIGLIMLISSAKAFDSNEFNDIVHNCMPVVADFYQNLTTNFSSLEYTLDDTVEFIHNFIIEFNHLVI